MIEVQREEVFEAKIKIFGVGGAGGNAINNMVKQGIEGVEFWVANTDAQDIEKSLATFKLKLGVSNKGLGAGGDPERGKEAALESMEDIKNALIGTDMLFITAGMGGGTGTGASPIIAKVARELNILTVAVVTKPFDFEGKLRMNRAESGLEELKKNVDALITIPNNRLLALVDKSTPLLKAFGIADDVLYQAVRGISDLITINGLINIDFADVRSVMQETGVARIGIGVAGGESRAREAAEKAISNPLLEEVSLHGSKGLLLNITGGYDLTLAEVEEAANIIKATAREDANIRFGAIIDENMNESIRITVVATGFDGAEKKEYYSYKGRTKRPIVINEDVPDEVLDIPAYVRWNVD
ncbi:MAG: cell division protein FtsZ [Proteobacteria bacterium]|nr:cell division protein FtsZ [Pseudomonadota bacterium]